MKNYTMKGDYLSMPACKYIVRPVIMNDLPAILDLLHEFHEETLDDFGMFCNDDITKELMPKLVPTSLALIQEDKVVGILSGIITNYVLSDRKCFQELVWYVSKKHRRYGIKLYRALDQFSKSLGAKYVIMANMGEERDESFHKFYLKEGFRHLETQYIKNLED